MNRFVQVLLIVGAAAGLILGLRAVLDKDGPVTTAANAVWNDPQVKKVRRRATKKLKKAKKSAEKAARQAKKALDR